MKSYTVESASTETDRALQARCERALEDALTNRGHPLREVDRVLAENPRFVFGHRLRMALIVRADSAGDRAKLIASMTAIEASPDAGDLARHHASAAHAWLYGNPNLAVERYAAILTKSPRDILALAVAHALDFRLGQRRMLRDRVAQVLSAWEPSLPGYASVLAMYAFGLEETGRYRRAEKVARRALALDPRHPGAVHVIAHVLEMQGRAREGLEFLAATEAAWKDTTGISVHLAWHRALFHLDADDPASALAVYDAQIAKPGAAHMSELADASALLWRLQLRNFRVAERGQSLADRWEMQPWGCARPFYTAHAMMAFAAAGRWATMQRLMGSLPQIDTSSINGSYPEEALMLPLGKALLAFAKGHYAGCVEALRHVRHIAHRCGGSLAQCDLVHLTLTEAALRAHKANLARALVAERTAMKPGSRLNQWLSLRLA